MTDERTLIDKNGEVFDILMDAVCGTCGKRFADHWETEHPYPFNRARSTSSDPLMKHIGITVCRTDAVAGTTTQGWHPGPYFKDSAWLKNRRNSRVFYGPRASWNLEKAATKINPNLAFKKRRGK